jgi:hypothetical protein
MYMQLLVVFIYKFCLFCLKINKKIPWRFNKLLLICLISTESRWCSYWFRIILTAASAVMIGFLKAFNIHMNRFLELLQKVF